MCVIEYYMYVRLYSFQLLKYSFKDGEKRLSVYYSIKSIILIIVTFLRVRTLLYNCDFTIPSPHKRVRPVISLDAIPSMIRTFATDYWARIMLMNGSLNTFDLMPSDTNAYLLIATKTFAAIYPMPYVGGWV